MKNLNSKSYYPSSPCYRKACRCLNRNLLLVWHLSFSHKACPHLVVTIFLLLSSLIEFLYYFSIWLSWTQVVYMPMIMYGLHWKVYLSGYWKTTGFSNLDFWIQSFTLGATDSTTPSISSKSRSSSNESGQRKN